jgi:hypothetical protein
VGLLRRQPARKNSQGGSTHLDEAGSRTDWWLNFSPPGTLLSHSSCFGTQTGCAITGPSNPCTLGWGVREVRSSERGVTAAAGRRTSAATCSGPMLGTKATWQDHAESGRRGQGVGVARRAGGGRGRPASREWRLGLCKLSAWCQSGGYRPVLPAVARIDEQRVTHAVWMTAKQVGGGVTQPLRLGIALCFQ